MTPSVVVRPLVRTCFLAMMITTTWLVAATSEESKLIPVTFLEPVAARAKEKLPAFRRLSRDDPRAVKGYELLENEAAKLIRELLYALPRSLPNPEPLLDLYIAIERGGNYARQGFSLIEGEMERDQQRTPYLVLEVTPERMSHTLLHESGHVLHRIARRFRLDSADRWTALPHTTFAVTDRVTALSEGYAIHLEALWGYFGSESKRRAFYHHLSPGFGPQLGLGSEYYFPVRDLLSFSQNWARYQAVRDGLAAFRGHIYPGDYLRSQFDPARDRSHLKSPGEMVASEGVVASTMFWLATGRAEALGARSGGGLDQRGLLQAEQELLVALQAAHDQAGPDATVVDVIRAYGARWPDQKRAAIRIFLDLTRGVTAARQLQVLWGDLYQASLALDGGRVQVLAQQIERLRAEIISRALQDPSVLQAELAPVIPVRAKAVMLQIKAFGDPFPLEFDLNAAGRAEVEAVTSLTEPQRARILAEMAKEPFRSFADFQQRTGLQGTVVGLELITPVQ